MPCKAKCLKNASLAHGIILFLISGVACLISLALTIYWFIMKHIDHSYGPIFMVGLGLLIFFALPFKYSLKLIEGILTIEPSYIKKYLIFGVTSNIIVFSITVYIMKNVNLLGCHIILVLSINFIYSMLNFMVYMTYLEVKKESQTAVQVAIADILENGHKANNKEMQNPTAVLQEPTNPV